MRHSLLAACVASALLAPASMAAQAPATDTAAASRRTTSGPGGSELPLETTRTVKFETDEGTWMSVDVSPDARTLVFDLAGDVYTLPMAGGRATRLTSGNAYDAQPRWSPDGRQIVYVTDRDGSDDVWLMDADGKNPRQVTKTDRTQFLSPDWTPDGKYVIVSRNATLFGTTYNLWLYHRNGGSGVRMTGATPPPAGGAAPAGAGGAANAMNYVGPAFGKDPRYVYASARNGGAAGYNQTGFDWRVVAYDRETGETNVRALAMGGAFRPVLSPDGRFLVYGTRQDTVTSLRLRDLATGDERWLVRNVQRDDMESRFTRDLMPNMDFTADSRTIVAAWGGKLRRIDVATGTASVIPFTADVEQQLGALSKFEYPVNDSTLTVGQIRGARPSPDGRRLAFTALDKLWVMELPNGTATRLTQSPHTLGEHSPVWTPDGRSIVYVTWTDSGGDIQRITADGKGRATRLTRTTAYYSDVNVSPDGRRVVAYRGPRQSRVEEMPSFGRELVWLPIDGGALTVISQVGNVGWPHFTRAQADRIWLYDAEDGLVSMRLDGTDRKAHLKVTGNPDYRLPAPRPSPADEILVSPEGDRALAQVDNNIYVLDIPAVGAQPPTISVATPTTASVPVRRLTRIGGDFAGWVGNGRQAYYSIGRSYFAYDLDRADSLVRDSTTRGDSLKRVAGGAARAATDSATRDTAKAVTRPAYEPVRTDVSITVKRDRPTGTVVFRNARVLTMKGEEVFERGDVFVRDNRIAGVGAAGSLQVPAGTKEYDVAGKTIVPGFVDTHAHLRPPFGVHKAQVWEYLANLAYGVTTTRDPQTGTTDVLSYGDLVETGDIVGPRIYSTGPGVFWSDDIKSLADARDVLRRYSEFYDTKTIKQYMVGDRKVRQWVVQATHELGLTPTLEGGLDYKKNLTEAMDGYAGLEHSFPIAPLYRDNLQLLAESGTTYTPTLLVIYGGPWTENLWYQRHDVLADAKLGRFTPRAELQQRGLRRPGWWHESQYATPLIAAQARKLIEAGGRVGIGSHGQLQGLGYHWEMWSLAMGQVKPADVLRAATIHGADALGLSKDLGSIEVGKLADLVILDANPMDDIKNTNTVRWVMKNGRLYDGSTLSEMYPRVKDIGKPWWQNVDAMAAPVHGDEH